MLWTEKYRPKKFEDVIGQEPIVKRIKAFVENKNIPHLLLAGPAGIGKTTLALVIAQEMFGDQWKHNFMETNASDERGIDVIRNKIKDFARTKSLGTDMPKIIYLDECDSLTKEAQQALRRTMETFSANTRFVLSCNFSSKIIDPIQSRCAVFRFKLLQEKEIEKIIDTISKGEGLSVNDEAKKDLFEVSGGDVRRVTNILQSSSVLGKEITSNTILEVASAAKPKEIKETLELAIKGQFTKARDSALNVMLNHGLSGLDMIKQIQSNVWESSASDNIKVKMISHCGEIEFRMVEGADEFVQIEALLAYFVFLNKQ